MSATIPSRPRTGSALLWGALGVLIFSGSLPATRIALLGGLDAGFIGSGRAAVAGLMAASVLLWRREWRPPPGSAASLLLIAMGVIFGWPLLTAYALRQVPSVHGAVLTGVLPAATAAMGVLRAGERPPVRFWLAAAAGLLAVLGFAAVQGAGSLSASDLMLLLAVALCGLGYAEGGRLARRIGGVQTISLALVWSLPVSIPLTVWQVWAAPPSADWRGWAGFLYVAAVANYLGFFPWYRGLAAGGIARIGQLQLAQPVLSLCWAGLLLGEAVTPLTAGAALVVMACVMATQRAR